MTASCHPEVLRRIWRRTSLHAGSGAYLTMTIAALSKPAKSTLTLFVPVDPVTLDAARRGDRKACGVLLSQLQDIWFRFAMGLLHDRELAADATQETALRFLKQISTFRGQSELRTWSLGIALNVTRELKRKKQLTSDPDDLPPPPLIPTTTPPPPSISASIATRSAPSSNSFPTASAKSCSCASSKIFPPTKPPKP